MLASLLFVLSSAAVAVCNPVALSPRASKTNDYSCRSDTHPNPVITLHGLFANDKFDLNFLEDWLRPKGFCTFTLNYGFYPLIPLGGLKPINESAVQIADFIKHVVEKTGAEKVDLIGHSEGALQSLYVPKFEGVAHLVDRIIAIAPPTNGSTLGGIETLVDALHLNPLQKTLLNILGCGACNDVLVGGGAVERLNDGPIVQPGNTVTVIASRHDELVTPHDTAFIHEKGVTNIFVQDYCPHDPVGHLSLAIDKNVWNLALNSLDDKIGRKFDCVVSLPIKREDEYSL